MGPFRTPCGSLAINRGPRRTQVVEVTHAATGWRAARLRHDGQGLQITLIGTIERIAA